MLRLSLLGFPTVFLDDVPVTAFISQKSLVLLCYLVLESRIHARESLAGLFWGDLPQDRALSNLRQALHNLQRLLPEYFVVTRQLVWFDTARPYASDVALLDADSIGLEVLSLHQDSFLSGVVVADAADVEIWISRRREHYSLRYATHLSRLLADAFDRRDIPLVEQTAHRLITHEPYHEPAYHLLWRVLVRQGHINKALASVAALRTLLQNDLGIAPSTVTQRLAQQLSLAQGMARHNIPEANSPFVGRDDERTRISHLLRQAECRLVTLCGIGGAGKSRLAQEFGRVEADFYINGAAYISLSALTDKLYLYTALADALGLSLQNVTNVQQAIEAFLAEREMLLIFDNAEHLPDFPLWVSGILQAAPFVRVLVTSRQRLNLREEWVVTLDGLPFSDSPDTPSVDLLMQMASRNDQHITRNADAVALCAVLEGLPLGIELAGSLLTSNGVSTLLESIRNNLDYVQTRWLNAEPHHRSLRAVFQASWDRLSENERTALANLAVFDSLFSTDAAQTVADAPPALLRRLVSASLVREEGAYWSLHTVIRTYARERQATPDILAARFETYALGIIAQAEEDFTARRVKAAVTAMHSEIGNLRQLWHEAVNARRILLLTRLSFTMHRFYEGAGWFAEGLAFFRQALEPLTFNPHDTAERGLLGRLKMHEAGLLLRLGNVMEAVASAQEATVCLVQEESDPSALAFALNTFGIAQLYQGDTTAARQTLEQCAGIYRQLALPELLKPLINLGAIYNRTGDTDSACIVLEEAQGIARRISDDVGGFHIANALGLTHMLRNEYAAARQYFEEALALSETTGFLSGKAIVLNNLGDVFTLIGQPQTGVRYAQEAVTLARQLEDRRGIIFGLTTLALGQLALANTAATALLHEALQLAQQSQAVPLIMTVLYAAGEWYTSAGRPDEADRLWRMAAVHPATEMDYRRRMLARLPSTALAADTSEKAIATCVTRVMDHLASEAREP